MYAFALHPPQFLRNSHFSHLPFIKFLFLKSLNTLLLFQISEIDLFLQFPPIIGISQHGEISPLAKIASSVSAAGQEAFILLFLYLNKTEYGKYLIDLAEGVY